MYGRWKWYSRLRAKFSNDKTTRFRKSDDLQGDSSKYERDEEESVQDTPIATPATEEMRGAEILENIQRLASVTSLSRKSLEGTITRQEGSGWNEAVSASAEHAYWLGDEAPYLPEPVFDSPIFVGPVLDPKSPSGIAIALVSFHLTTRSQVDHRMARLLTNRLLRS